MIGRVWRRGAILQVKSLKGGLEFRFPGQLTIQLYLGMPLVATLLTYPLWRGFRADGLIAAVLVGIGAMLSVLAHELGHAAVAKRVGLKPSLIRLYALGGDVTWQAKHWTRAEEQRILWAGPLVNLLLGLVCLGAYWLLLQAPALLGIADPEHGRTVFLSPPPKFDPVPLRVLHWLGWINLVLGFLNLLPAYPLDGGRLAHNWIERRYGRARALFWLGLSGTGLAILAKLAFVMSLLAGMLIWAPPDFAPNWAAFKKGRRLLAAKPQEP